MAHSLVVHGVSADGRQLDEVWKASSRIGAMTQSFEGYIWIGTSSGLARYDGHKVISIAATAGIPVASLLISQQGGLWVGYGGARGMVRLNGSLVVEKIVPGGDVNALAEGTSGDLWIGTSLGLWLRPPHETNLHRKPLPPGHEAVTSLLMKSNGILWVGTNRGLVEIAKTATRVLSTSSATRTISRAASDDDVWVIEDLRGAVTRWHGDKIVQTLTMPQGLIGNGGLSIIDEGLHQWIGGTTGLQHGRLGAWTYYTAPALPDERVTSLLLDADHTLLIGTWAAGLMASRHAPASTVGPRDGLKGNVVFSVMRASDGSMWMTTDKALVQSKGGELSHFLYGKNLPTYCGRSLVEGEASRDGLPDLWIGACDIGLIHFEGGVFKHVVEGPLRADLRVQNVWRSRAGAILVAPSQGGVISYQQGKARILSLHEHACDKARSDPCPGLITAALEDETGWWFGSAGLGLLRYENGRWNNEAASSALASTPISALFTDRRGDFWVGTSERGLWRKQGADFVRVLGNIPKDLTALGQDRQDGLWLGSKHGVFHLPAAQVSMAVRGLGAEAQRFGRLDGMQAEECASTYQPSVARALDGTMWFPTQLGVSVFLPNAAARGRQPTLLIEEVWVDGRGITIGAKPLPEIQFQPGRGDLRVDFTAPTTRLPHRIDFDYKLSGYDEEWRAADASRRASYTNLPSGHYTFEVRAAGGTEYQSTLKQALHLMPHFYETVWFVVLCLAAAGLLMAGLYLMRLSHLRARFQATLAERNRIARDVHDALAQGFTGIGYQLSRLGPRLPADDSEGLKIWRTVRQLLNYCRLETRYAIADLRDQTLEDRTLEEQLRDIIKQTRLYGDIDVHLSVQGEPVVIKLPAREALCRIAREATINAVVHGDATRVNFVVDYGTTQIGLIVEDNGKGFVASAPATLGMHFGILGMRERVLEFGGTIDMRQAHEGGTQMKVSLPKNRAHDD